MAAPYPIRTGPERQMLLEFLDYYRAVLLDKASGLSGDQLDTRLGPSTLTLGGIVNHMALVELWWFQQCLAGHEDAGEPWDSAPWDDDPDWDFTSAARQTPQTILDRYVAACQRSREVMEEHDDLDALSARPHPKRPDEHWSVRWILIHMIEETARHAGHADLIRESIDGATGDFRDDA